ncbi:MAG TPA: cupin domain-containing protein [Gillisia sp.]|nr:cupin domain-containing protein [Gillisia sp.]
MESISLQSKFEKFHKNWNPHQIAVVDDMQVLLAKLKGEFIWHAHEEEDELFQVVKGTLYIQFRDKTVEVKEGEIIVVPKGVEHCPMTKNDEEVHVMLFEKLAVKHTGTVENERTVSTYLKI